MPRQDSIIPNFIHIFNNKPHWDQGVHYTIVDDCQTVHVLLKYRLQCPDKKASSPVRANAFMSGYCNRLVGYP